MKLSPGRSCAGGGGNDFNLLNFMTMTTLVVQVRSWANLINIQRLGLKIASTGIHKGLRVTVIFESYKHELEAY